MASAVPELPLLARDQAFEELYRSYVKDVYHYALALLRNPADAEDVTQTTFMNAYRAYQRGDQILKPHNWLIKIAHNVARTRYARASRRVKEVPLEDHVDHLAVPEDERPNVEGVLRALGRLPFNQRAALVMRELDGRSYVEIADTLGVSVSAVETLIFRARKALRMRASSLRVLTAVPLPGSLSQLFGGGAVVAGGGAVVRTGFLAKAAVALIAGAFATGIGGDDTGPAGAAQSDQLGSAPALTSRTGLIAGKLDAADRSGARPAAGGRTDSANATRSGIARDATGTARTDSTQSTTQAGTPGPGSSAAPASPSTQAQEAVTDVVTQVEEAAGALPVQVPAPPALPVEVPALPQLPLEPPPLPPIPKLP